MTRSKNTECFLRKSQINLINVTSTAANATQISEAGFVIYRKHRALLVETLGTTRHKQKFKDSE